MKNSNLIFYTFLFLCTSKIAFSQFSGPAGSPNSNAIHKDSSIFSYWASNCQIFRGYKDIANPDSGLVEFGTENNATGQADGLGVVSLGDGGYAILTFNNPIKNKPGFDFAVFENSVWKNFLELAFVEVSSNGVDYFRFPAISNSPNLIQIGPFDNVQNAEQIHNLAGKYVTLFGTPFDLGEISDNPNLNKDAISYIKIIDVVGSINPQYASYDSNENIINDPYPTPFLSGGFDLDAVGVIQNSLSYISSIEKNNTLIYPNPAIKGQQIKLNYLKETEEISVIDISGKKIYTCIHCNTIETYSLSEGFYLLELKNSDSTFYCKLNIIN